MFIFRVVIRLVVWVARIEFELLLLVMRRIVVRFV